MASRRAVLRKKSVHREFIVTNSHETHSCSSQHTRGISQLHQNSSFPASLGFYTSRSGPGRSAVPAVGDAFERCPQSGNIFLRKQLALYLERKVSRDGRPTPLNISMVLLSRLFAWQNALINVKPETFLGWHRKGFQLLWRWKSRPRGRPRVPRQLRELICKMAHQNQTWGEERIAAELLLKLGIQVSPRTVRRYMPTDVGPGKRVPSQRWMTFVRNHAQAIVACDFFIVVTASFRVLYVFVLLEVGTRRIAHFNVTAHPTATWTLQQFREVMMHEQSYRFVLHDRDRIYSSEIDSALQAMDLKN